MDSGGGSNRPTSKKQQSQRKLTSAAAQHQPRHQHTDIVDDIPHFSDDQSLDLDSLDITPRQLKRNLSSSTRSNDSRGTASRGRHPSFGATPGGSVSSGGSGGRTKRLVSLAEDHVDVPHLDDLRFAETDGADAAAGGGEGRGDAPATIAVTVAPLEEGPPQGRPQRRNLPPRTMLTASGRVGFMRSSTSTLQRNFYGDFFDPDEFDDNGEQRPPRRRRGRWLCAALVLVGLAAAVGFLAAGATAWTRGGTAGEDSSVVLLDGAAAAAGAAAPEGGAGAAPGREDVARMSIKERVELAERIHRGCRTRPAASDCGDLCREKACCFAREGEEDAARRMRRRTPRALDAAGPTLARVGIPGDPDFAFVAEGGHHGGDEREEEEEEGGAAGAAAAVAPPALSENCVDDAEQFCTTYAGCAPFFGEE